MICLLWARSPRETLAKAAASFCLFLFPISPRGRALDDDRLIGVDHGIVAAGQVLHPPVLAARPVLADLAGLPAREANAIAERIMVRMR